MEFLKPMKVKEYGGQPVAIAQQKFDGYYAEVYKSRSIPGHIFVCTKKQEVNLWPKLKKHPVICNQLLQLPMETVLRCELHAFNVHATSVPTMINDADERLLLSPYCIEQWGGTKPYYSFDEEWVLLIGHGFTVSSRIDLSLTPKVINNSEIEFLLQKAKRYSYEGWVLKDKPRGNCYKIKPQKTVDAFVVDYTISDSDTYAGGLKSVDIAVYHEDLDFTFKEVIIGTVGTGFEGDYRMSVDLPSLIGRVGEFKYQELGARGRLKFPRFLRWRDDEKTKEQCLYSQLKGV